MPWPALNLTSDKTKGARFYLYGQKFNSREAWVPALAWFAAQVSQSACALDFGLLRLRKASRVFSEAGSSARLAEARLP